MTLSELEAEVRAILVPYEDVLEASEIDGMEVLRRPGAKPHDWFAGVRCKGDALQSIEEPLFRELEALTQRGYEQTAGDPGWGVAKREEHGMDYRRAMSVDRATHDARRRAARPRAQEA